jgi:hypothetical protein
MKMRTSLRLPNLTLFPKKPSKQRIAELIRDLPIDVTDGAMLRSNRIDTYKPTRPYIVIFI